MGFEVLPYLPEPVAEEPPGLFALRRAAVDDLLPALEAIKRRRVIAISIYSASDELEDLFAIQAVITAAAFELGFRPLNPGLYLHGGSYGAVLFAETPRPQTKPEMLESSKKLADEVEQDIKKDFAKEYIKSAADVTKRWFLVVIQGAGLVLLTPNPSHPKEGGAAGTSQPSAIIAPLKCPDDQLTIYTVDSTEARNAGGLKQTMTQYCVPPNFKLPKGVKPPWETK